MSRAFVNEDAIATGTPALPDRPVSGSRNLVTRRGLALIEAALHGHKEALARLDQEAERERSAWEERELRYWQQRRSTAELSEPDPHEDSVVFGTAVTVAFDDGREATYRIVGEDEGDPAAGRIAYTTPVARALTGGIAGETRSLPKGEVEILRVDATPEPVPPSRH